MIPIIVIVSVVMLIFYVGYRREKNNQIKYIDGLIENTGKPLGRVISSQELSMLKMYCDYKADTTIDDITWNDLNLDLIYARMNYCNTSAGDETLYYWLRKPRMDADWQKYEDKVTELTSNSDLKRKILNALCNIGRSGKYSVYHYLDVLDDVNTWPDYIDYILLLSYIPGIAICFMNALIGAMLVFAAMIINISTYFKFKRRVESYLVCFQYIVRAIKGTDEFSKINSAALNGDLSDLKENRNRLKAISSMALVAIGNTGNSPVAIVLDYIKMLTHIDLIIFKSMLNKIKENKQTVVDLLDIIGRIDCMISVGEYRASLDKWCTPEFNEKSDMLIDNGYHPLIKKPVCNSVNTSNSILITGSNASGKSTYLRMIAVNCLLAQSIHTVLADNYIAPCFSLFTSLSLKDDIVGGDSYYMAEIKSIKRILDAAKNKVPIIAFVDEVLRGTNTVERIASSCAILKNMVQAGILVFAATHDIELTYLLEEFDNYHFEENMINGDVDFSYLIKKGRATTRNAIALLEVMGYDKTIIELSKKMVSQYEEKGNWN